MTVALALPLGVGTTLRILSEIVAEFGPDYIYDTEVSGGCLYRTCSAGITSSEYRTYPELPNDIFTPSCLIGHLAFRAGFLNRLHEGAVTDHGNPVFFTATALGAVSAAQMAQDGGHSWGEALANAYEAADRHDHAVQDERNQPQTDPWAQDSGEEPPF